MPESADLYEILQVHPAAHPEVIQAAYLRLAELNDPVHNPAPDAGARLAEINRAYGILSDPQQRTAYDAQRTGAAAGNGGELGGGAVVHDVVRAKSFQLVNDSGQTRAEMTLDADGDPMLFMNDRNGQRRFRIYQMTGGKFALVINDWQGKARLWLGEANDGTPMIFMTDRNGNRRFAIYQDESGQQEVVINDRQGNARLWIGESDDGTPMLYMTDIVGKQRFAIYQDTYGSQDLIFIDKDEDVTNSIGEDRYR